MTVFLHDMLAASASRYPEDPAVIQGARRVSYKELAGMAEGLAARLAASGLGPGDRVLLLLDNSPEYVAALFAVSRAGGVSVPYSHLAPERSLEAIVADCAPSVVIGRADRLRAIRFLFGGAPSVRSVIAAAPGEFRFLEGEEGAGAPGRPFAGGGPGKGLALILYTSGTSGNPKGVMLTHGNLAANAASIIEYLKLTHEDRVMVILPFGYSYGNSLLTTHVLAGGSMVLENSFLFPNTVLDRIRDERVTGFAGVPSTFAILLGRSNLGKRSFPALRYVTQAGGAMSHGMALNIKAALPGTDVYIMYGQTEASPRLTYLDPGELERKPGSIGKAIPGVRISVVGEDGAPAFPGEVGELVAEGDNIMAGYWNRPEETEAVLKGGRLYTGDLARTDDEGFLYIVGRRSEMIKTSGHRVSPKELENVLSGMKGVAETAVVGVPDAVLGQAIRAYVVRDRGGDVSEKDVLKFCAGVFEPFLVPREVVFLDELPKKENGKIDRIRLMDRG